MGEIFIKELGQKTIAGDTPTADELAAFRAEAAQTKVMIPDLGERSIKGKLPTPDEISQFRDQRTAVQFEQPFTPPPPAPPRKLVDRTRQDYGLPDTYRQQAEMAGSLVGEVGGRALGGLVGAPAGPGGIAAGVVLGGTAGDVAGTTAGNTLYQLADTAYRMYQDQPPRHKTFMGPTLEAAKSAKDAAMFNMGAGTLGRGLVEGGKFVGGKIFGTNTDEIIDTARRSEAEGAGLALVDVSGRARQLAQPMAVLPFVGGVFRRHAEKVNVRVRQDFEDYLDELAPLQSVTELGHNWMDIVRSGNRAFMETLVRMRKDMYDLSKELGDPQFIPTTDLARKSEEILDQLRRGQKQTKGGEPLQIDSPEYAKFVEQLEKFTRYGNASLPQYKRLSSDVKGLFKQARDLDIPASDIKDLKLALESGMSNNATNFGGPGAKKLIALVNSHKNVFLEGIKKYETTTAKRSFGRVDKSVLTGGYFKAGSREADELFQAAWRPGSLDTTKNLEKLLGREGIEQALRRHIDDAWESAKFLEKEGAVDFIRIDAGKFRKDLGLDTKQGQEVLRYILKDSGASVGRFDELTKRLDILDEVNLPSLSTFLQRRVTLAGLQGLTGAVAFGQASPLGALLALGTLYKGAKFLTDPDMLAALTTKWKQATTPQKKYALTERILRDIVLDEPPPDAVLGLQTDTYDDFTTEAREIRGSGVESKAQPDSSLLDNVSDEAKKAVDKLVAPYQALPEGVKKRLEQGIPETLGVEEYIPEALRTDYLKFR